MHILVREITSLDEQAPAEDLQHEPADIVFLSFSDNDLNVMASCIAQQPENSPSIQLVSLNRLRHPMSVDLYLDQTISKSKFIILRLLGGIEAWRYGTEEIHNLCQSRHIPLAIISGENYENPHFDNLSTIPANLLNQFKELFLAGGKENYSHILNLAAHHLDHKIGQSITPHILPMVGEYPLPYPFHAHQNLAVILFYRSHLLANNIEPILSLAQSLFRKGINIKAVYLTSLKDPEISHWVGQYLYQNHPTIILNATYFSIQQDYNHSLFRTFNVPVLQILQPSNSKHLWKKSFRGLSQTDLAIQVVLPELDGKISTTAIGFKKEKNNQTRYEPYQKGIDLVTNRVNGWVNLRKKNNHDKKIAIILSNYPGVSGQEGHAVGLDSFASLEHILQWLKKNGYQTGSVIPDCKNLIQILCQSGTRATLSLTDYKQYFSTLSTTFRKKVLAYWPEFEKDETLQKENFTIRYIQLGHIICAIQPERADSKNHKNTYHDPDIPPCHGYIAFYLWLRHHESIDAIIHLGTHGTLEWLPSKATAISDHCSPAVLLGGLPVIYPFIVNNPGEAACAKRRLGAVTIGHLTPPVNKTILSGDAAELERLIDDYAEADGLDHRRSKLLLGTILDKAESCGLLAETGINRKESGDEVALNHLDAYLCDVKDLQIREGLHIFGKPPIQFQHLLETIKHYAPDKISEIESNLYQCAEHEKQSLLNALNGEFIQPGPAGAPTRGKLDVLPTGRNLYTVDPRGIPTRTAYLLAEKMAGQLLLKFIQENGDHLRHIVIDLWGSTNLRTGGEDLALAYILMGVKPIRDTSSNRVTSIEIIPLAKLNRPRVDVTLRISGFFRDAFEDQITLFDQTVKTLAQRAEDKDWNYLAYLFQNTPPGSHHSRLNRIYGTAQRTYGTGIEYALNTGNWREQAELGERWLENSAYSYGNGQDGIYDKQGLSERLKTTQAFFHSQDHAEIDLLDSADYAAHEGGFAAAAKLFDNTPNLYHGDTSKAENPKIRLLVEEVNRIVRGRVANPMWIKAMMNHSYRGAAEIARSVDALFSFSATLSHCFDQQFELVFAATLGNDTVNRFLQNSNPAAKKSIQNRFNESLKRGLWHPKSNSVFMKLEESDE